MFGMMGFGEHLPESREEKMGRRPLVLGARSANQIAELIKRPVVVFASLTDSVTRPIRLTAFAVVAEELVGLSHGWFRQPLVVLSLYLQSSSR